MHLWDLISLKLGRATLGFNINSASIQTLCEDAIVQFDATYLKTPSKKLNCEAEQNDAFQNSCLDGVAEVNMTLFVSMYILIVDMWYHAIHSFLGTLLRNLLISSTSVDLRAACQMDRGG